MSSPPSVAHGPAARAAPAGVLDLPMERGKVLFPAEPDDAISSSFSRPMADGPSPRVGENGRVRSFATGRLRKVAVRSQREGFEDDRSTT